MDEHTPQLSRRERNAVEKRSLPEHIATLATEIELTRENARAEVSEFLVEEIYRELAGYPVELVQRAFRAHRRRSPFFPVISEMHDLIRELRAQDRAANVEQRRREERERIQKAREQGKLITWEEVRAAMQSALDKAALPAALCKGSFALGTACGECARCKAEAAKPKTMPAAIENWSSEELAEHKRQEKQKLAKHLNAREGGRR